MTGRRRACGPAWLMFALVLGGQGPMAGAEEPEQGAVVSFPPLVPDGEPESLLGVNWKSGQPTFGNAPLPSSVLNAVAYSPDGKTLASASHDKTVRLWDLATGRELRRLEGHSSSVSSVAFSPDGKTLASASSDKTLRLWDVTTGRGLRRLEGHSSSVWSVAHSPDGKTIASASSDKTLRLWDVATGRELRRFEGHSSLVLSVAYSPDGKTIASASDDKTVRLWDAASGRELRRLEGHSDSVRSVAFSPDGKTLASASYDKTVRLWDVASGRELRRLEGHSSLVRSVAFSPDGKTLASASYDKTVCLWNVATGRELRRLEGHSSLVLSVAYGPGGKSLASASADKTVRLWDVATGRELRRLEGHSSSVWSVAYGPDGKTLVSTSDDKTVRLWDVATGRELRRFERRSFFDREMAYGLDGKRSDSAGSERRERLWDVATDRELRRPEGHSSLVRSVASPDGKTLASAGSDDTVRLWNAASGREFRRLEGHSSLVRSVAYSPDGKTLASASDDKTVRLWDVATGRELHRLEGHSDGVLSVAYSPDGKCLASASDDETVRLWDRRGMLSMVFWSDGDGWLAWRADEAPEHRVLRGDSGSLLVHRGDDGSVATLPPNSGKSPRLTAEATMTVNRPAGQGEMGEALLTVTNAADATPAFWIELRAAPVQPGSPAGDVVVRPPPMVLRLDPGASTTIPMEFTRATHDNPRPGTVKLTLELHHAHDGGKGIAVPVELAFESPEIAMTAKPPVGDVGGTSVPIIVSNIGNQATGRALTIGARFLLSNGRTVDSDNKTVFDNGLLPGDSRDFSLKVPIGVTKKFQVLLNVTEGFGPGMPEGSPLVGFASTWTPLSRMLTPRTVWTLYILLALALLVLAAGGYILRVYRDPVVVAAGKLPASLAKQPLRDLPNASRAMARARRLDGTLATLGISEKRWRQALEVSRQPDRAVQILADVLGAPLAKPVDGTSALGAVLPDLRLRFGPEVALAVLSGPRVEPGDAQRLTEALRSTGIAAAIILDLTDAENGRKLFGEVARFAGVVLSSAQVRDVLLADQPLTVLEAAIAEQRPLREISPYRTAGGVEAEALFFGRAEELRKLADRDLQNAVLVGARQMGKSSLLKAVKRRLATRAGIDVHYRVLSGDDLMAELASALDQPAPKGVADFQSLVRGSKARPRVWLIDEADAFTTTDLSPEKRGAVSWALRALAEEGTTYFVLAGFWELFRSAVFTTDSPIRNLGELIRLGPLDAASAEKLVRDPMQALGLVVEDAVVADLLKQTGCRANLMVLACQGLIERLAQDQRTLVLADLQRVWSEHAPLRDALLYWKAKGLELDRAVVHAALSLDRPTRADIEACMRAAGISKATSELDQTFERLELGYVLLRDSDAGGGADRWTCPIPLIARFEARMMSWAEHLRRDAEDLRG